jgi:hypothetical protein
MDDRAPSVTDLCLASERCIGFDRRANEPALTDDLPVCEGCLLAGERAVPALVLDYRDLEQHLPPSLGVWGDGQPASRDDHPVPLNLAVEACQREIWHVLTCWEEIVREREKLSDSVTRQVRAGWAVQAAAQILTPRVRLLAAIGPVLLCGYPSLDEDELQRYEGIEYADVPGWRGVVDFTRLHNRARTLLGLTSPQPERVQLVPCRDCDLLTLYRVPAEDTVRCGSCSAIFTLAEFRRWAGLVAEYAKPKEAG